MDKKPALERWEKDPEEGSVVRHLNPSGAEKSFRCERPDCALGFDTQQDLDNHLLEHEKPFKCDSSGCGKTFKQRYYLNDHSSTHQTGVLTCTQCGKKIKRKRDLKRHLDRYCNERRLQQQVGELEMVNAQDVGEPSGQGVGEPSEQHAGQAMYHVPIQPIVPVGDKSPELALHVSNGEDMEIDLYENPKEPDPEKVKKVNILVSSVSQLPGGLQESAEGFGENDMDHELSHRQYGSFHAGQDNTAESESNHSWYRAWNNLQQPVQVGTVRFGYTNEPIGTGSHQNCLPNNRVDQVAGDWSDHDSERDVSHLNNLEDTEMYGYSETSVTAPQALQVSAHALDWVSEILSTTDESFSEQFPLMGITSDGGNSEFEDRFAMIQAESDWSDPERPFSNPSEQMDWDDEESYK